MVKSQMMLMSKIKFLKNLRLVITSPHTFPDSLVLRL